MALRTFVKVSGINNLSDARYCAGMEVNELGFNIESDHENFTDPQKFKEMADWLSGVDFIGEIESVDSNISQSIKEYALDGIQIGHLEQIGEALATGLKVSFNASSIEKAEMAWKISKEQLDHVVVSNLDEPDKVLSSLFFPVIITDGFNAENISACLENISPKGIALKGGDEIRPGYKDFDELADILEVLEIDDLA